MITTCIEQDLKDKLYMQYCTIYPNMNKENFMSFEQFYNASVKPVRSKKSEKDIEAKKEESYAIANNIIKNFKIS